jgi:hypothetical protein
MLSCISTIFHEYKAIDMTSLLLLQGRGAAVLCANNQTGIDTINVFLRWYEIGLRECGTNSPANEE